MKTKCVLTESLQRPEGAHRCGPCGAQGLWQKAWAGATWGQGRDPVQVTCVSRGETPAPGTSRFPPGAAPETPGAVGLLPSDPCE